MINYKEDKILSKADLNFLYSSVGWLSYTQDLETLEKAVQQSLYVLSAWENKTLVGLLRAVGDGETILYIQDILIHPEYQNKKIGTTLMEKGLTRYSHVRQKTLLTSEAPDVRHFYEKCGFYSCDQGNEVAFYREY